MLRFAWAVHELPCELVSPNAWKKEFNLIKKDKDASRAVASGFYPKAPLRFMKDHNKADALLIARYLWIK